MILVDYRTGSKEFLEPIRDLLHAGDKVEICKDLPADFSFDGNLSGGKQSFGIERKTVSDLIDSMKTTRLVDHQIPAMQEFFDRNYLLIEGFYAPETDGRLKTFGRPSRMMYSSVDNFLNSLHLTTGITIMRSGSKAETVRMIVDLYNLVQKPWDRHKAHIGCYEPAILHLKRPGLVQRWAKELKGVAAVKSVLARKGFKTAYDLANADVDKWEGVMGHRNIAEKIWKEIRGIK